MDTNYNLCSSDKVEYSTVHYVLSLVCVVPKIQQHQVVCLGFLSEVGRVTSASVTDSCRSQHCLKEHSILPNPVVQWNAKTWLTRVIFIRTTNSSSLVNFMPCTACIQVATVRSLWGRCYKYVSTTSCVTYGLNRDVFLS